VGLQLRAQALEARGLELRGELDLSDARVETPEEVAARVRRALPYVPAGNILLEPDCGMKYLSRDAAFGKLRAMVGAATMLRLEMA